MDEISRYYFEKQMLFSLTHMCYEDCPYYACHNMKKQNCFFCYCPFYPCEDERKGKWLLTETKKVWDCSPCTWIHEDEVVKKILELLYEGKSFPEIKEIIW
ncbi:cysteine-rich small domain-containing protein [Thermospira aquatica]